MVRILVISLYVLWHPLLAHSQTLSRFDSGLIRGLRLAKGILDEYTGGYGTSDTHNGAKP